MKFATLILCIFGVFVYTRAATFEDGATACQSKVGATTSEVQSVLRYEIPKSKNEQCVLACMAKKWGIMMPNNKIDMEVVKNRFMGIKNQSEEMYNKTINAFKECSNVDVPTNECEAATMYIECIDKKETGFKTKKP